MRGKETSKQQEFPVGRSFVWAMMVALVGGASVGAFPLIAQPGVVIVGEDRRRADDRVYDARDWERNDELRRPGRNGRGAENGRGKKNGLRKRNSDWSSERNSEMNPEWRSERNSEVYGGYRTLNVERQYYPQPGQCRVWFADRPARYQLPAMSCERLYGRVPARSFILYNYRAWDAGFDWYRYDQQNPGRVPRAIVDISRSMRR